ncbi:hypothetical protein PF003_g36353 [Phytophthora fragariae]|nr:hypothetical protein PF003_g36353 [Phytophthora fragariae]
MPPPRPTRTPPTRGRTWSSTTRPRATGLYVHVEGLHQRKSAAAAASVDKDATYTWQARMMTQALLAVLYLATSRHVYVASLSSVTGAFTVQTFDLFNLFAQG